MFRLIISVLVLGTIAYVVYSFFQIAATKTKTTYDSLSQQEQDDIAKLKSLLPVNSGTQPAPTSPAPNSGYGKLIVTMGPKGLTVVR